MAKANENTPAPGVYEDNVILPGIFTYRRSISQGRALMWACETIEGQGAEPLLVELSGLRATKAYDFWKKVDDAAKKEGEYAKTANDIVTPNPQRVESAFMPESRPFLKVDFSVKYLPNALIPNVSANRDVDVLFRSLVKGYSQKGGFEYLGQQYVIPLVTGRWMWRNNEEAVQKFIRITVMGQSPQVFEFRPGYNCFTYDSLSSEDKVSATSLGRLIASALDGNGLVLGLRVEGIYEMGAGSMVYPSQEMTIDRKDGDPTRVLYKVAHGGNKNHAAIHEQKIGNSLRTIENWHGDELFGAIAVEPLGVVSSHQTSVRVEQRKDFYSLAKKYAVKWNRQLSEVSSLNEIENIGDLHYVIAVLIRGGVFA
jgi:CRISPR-associated protein Csy3